MQCSCKGNVEPQPIVSTHSLLTLITRKPKVILRAIWAEFEFRLRLPQFEKNLL